MHASSKRVVYVLRSDRKAPLLVSLGAMFTTFAVSLPENGISIENVSVLLGHSSVRITERRVRELAEQRVSFAFETTLASRSFAPWLRDLRVSGYTVHLFFLWLSSADLAVERVADRVRAGGHHVPPDTVRRRYRSGIRNFFSLYQPVVTSWALYNCSGPKSRLVAEGLESTPLKVYDKDVWAVLQRQGME